MMCRGRVWQAGIPRSAADRLVLARGGVLYAVDANGGQVVTVQPDTGRVERVVDISATQGMARLGE